MGNAAGDPIDSWLNPTSLLVGVLAVATSAYLAAVYLAADAARAGSAWPRRSGPRAGARRGRGRTRARWTGRPALRRPADLRRADLGRRAGGRAGLHRGRGRDDDLGRRPAAGGGPLVGRRRSGRDRGRLGPRPAAADPPRTERRPGRRGRRHVGRPARVVGHRGGDPGPIARAAVRVGAARTLRRGPRATGITRAGRTDGHSGRPARSRAPSRGGHRCCRLRGDRDAAHLRKRTAALGCSSASSSYSLPWLPALPTSCPRSHSPTGTGARRPARLRARRPGGCPRCG